MTSDMTMNVAGTGGLAGTHVENKTEGKWSLSGDTVTLTAQSINGKPIPADAADNNIKLSVVDGGKRLTGPESMEFKRQE